MRRFDEHEARANTDVRIFVTRKQITMFELALAALNNIDNPEPMEVVQKRAIRSQLTTLRKELKELERVRAGESDSGSPVEGQADPPL